MADPKRASGESISIANLAYSISWRHRLNPDGDLSGISRLGPDLARNIEAYPAYLPILWNRQYSVTLQADHHACRRLSRMRWLRQFSVTVSGD